PQTWGLAVPVTFSRTIAASDPFYLTNTDIRADALPGLRRPHATSSTYTFSARRVRRSPRGLGRLVIDPLSISGAFNTGGSRSELAQATGSSYGVNLDWTLIPGARTVRSAGADRCVAPAALFRDLRLQLHARSQRPATGPHQGRQRGGVPCAGGVQQYPALRSRSPARRRPSGQGHARRLFRAGDVAHQDFARRCFVRPPTGLELQSGDRPARTRLSPRVRRHGCLPQRRWTARYVGGGEHHLHRGQRCGDRLRPACDG